MNSKNPIQLLAAILLILIFSNCGQIKKQIAVDDLVGLYKGTVTTAVIFSALNEGQEDMDTSVSQTVSIVMTKDNLLKLAITGGEIKLNAIEMAANGATFNIPDQVINDEPDENGTLRIVGLNECMLGEMRCDGFYDSEKKQLNFSYSGKIKNKFGKPLQLQMRYHMSKQ